MEGNSKGRARRRGKEGGAEWRSRVEERRRGGGGAEGKGGAGGGAEGKGGAGGGAEGKGGAGEETSRGKWRTKR